MFHGEAGDDAAIILGELTIGKIEDIIESFAHGRQAFHVSGPFLVDLFAQGTGQKR
jgi:hypothetical protein